MKRIVSLCLVTLVAVSLSAQWTRPTDVPAYNAAPPAKGQKLPPILMGLQLTGPNFRHASQVASYKAAASIPKVLHQLPCYCYCDRGHGHNSLHSCFETEHGAQCSVCMEEALFAAEMTHKGKTAKQIRQAIIRGEYKSVALEN